MKTLGTIESEDVDSAMKVIERVRMEDALVAKDLTAGDRRTMLKDIARDAYREQGIEVSDETLNRAIEELDETRYRHDPVPPGLKRNVLLAYVHRGRTTALLAGAAALVVLAFQIPSAVHYVTVERPAQQAAGAEREAEARRAQQAAIEAEGAERQAAWQARADELSQTANAAAQTDPAREMVSLSINSLNRAISSGDPRAVGPAMTETELLIERIETPLALRIVDRSGEQSGVWRTRDNGQTRVHYLVVEAERADGQVMPWPVRSVETGRTSTVRTFAIRVDEETFERVGQDKTSDGIVDERDIGTKPAGDVQFDWSVPTTGDMITSW